MNIENIKFLSDEDVLKLSKKLDYLKYINPYLIELLKELFQKGQIYPTHIRFVSARWGCYKRCHLERMTELLETLGIEYKLGNDAPRGGQNGNYIAIKRRCVEDKDRSKKLRAVLKEKRRLVKSYRDKKLLMREFKLLELTHEF